MTVPCTFNGRETIWLKSHMFPYPTKAAAQRVLRTGAVAPAPQKYNIKAEPPPVSGGEAQKEHPNDN